MAEVGEIYEFLDRKAPFSSQMNFDNSGFLVGRQQADVRRVLIALDITESVISEAVEVQADLILSHHPVIFHPTEHISDRDPVGSRLLRLAEHGIAAICAHTNLDLAAGGVNDALALAAGIDKADILHIDGADPGGIPYGIGRFGTLEEPCTLLEYLPRLKTALRANGLRYADGGVLVRKVAVGGGACGDLLGEAYRLGCDTFITADLKYHEFLDAAEMGINLIDAGHFPTENVVCPVLAGWLRDGFPELEILLSEKHREVVSYL